MLAKVFRLTSPQDFKNVKLHGKVFHSKNFTLSIYKRTEGDAPRFGFIIPNKVVTRAVDRNRIKRVLSEATRYELTSLSPFVDCVFLPKLSMLSAYTADVMKEVAQAFQDAKIVK